MLPPRKGPTFVTKRVTLILRGPRNRRQTLRCSSTQKATRMLFLASGVVKHPCCLKLPRLRKSSRKRRKTLQRFAKSTVTASIWVRPKHLLPDFESWWGNREHRDRLPYSRGFLRRSRVLWYYCSLKPTYHADNRTTREAITLSAVGDRMPVTPTKTVLGPFGENVESNGPGRSSRRKQGVT